MKKLILISLLFFTLACDGKKSSEASTVAKEASKSVSLEDKNNNKSVLKAVTKLSGKVSFTLGDGEALNRQYPSSFEIPDRKSRENLKEGTLVKLIFIMTDGTRSQTERMWVLINKVDSSGYTGTLDNDPYCTDQIKSGLEVTFKPKNIISIY